MKNIKELYSELGGLVETVKNTQRYEWIRANNKELHGLCSFFHTWSYYGIKYRKSPPPNSLDVGSIKKVFQKEKIPFSVDPLPSIRHKNLHEIDVAPEIFGYDSYPHDRSYNDLLTGRVSKTSHLHIGYGFTLGFIAPVAFLDYDCYNNVFLNQEEAIRILTILKQNCKG